MCCKFGEFISLNLWYILLLIKLHYNIYMSLEAANEISIGDSPVVHSSAIFGFNFIIFNLRLRCLPYNLALAKGEGLSHKDLDRRFHHYFHYNFLS